MAFLELLGSIRGVGLFLALLGFLACHPARAQQEFATAQDAGSPQEAFSIQMCLQPAVAGICRASIQRYFFNSTAMQCQPFIYGGCKGNDNNWATVQECESSCNADAVLKLVQAIQANSSSAGGDALIIGVPAPQLGTGGPATGNPATVAGGSFSHPLNSSAPGGQLAPIPALMPTALNTVPAATTTVSPAAPSSAGSYVTCSLTVFVVVAMHALVKAVSAY